MVMNLILVSFPDNSRKEMENNKSYSFATGRNVIDSEHDRDHLQIIESVSVQLTEPETNNVIMDFFQNILQNRNFPFTSGCCTF